MSVLSDLFTFTEAFSIFYINHKEEEANLLINATSFRVVYLKFAYLFKNFGELTSYNIKKKLRGIHSRTPRQLQDIKNAANMTPQHKHTEKH